MHSNGQGDPVPKHRRNPRRVYDEDGREIVPMTIANAVENEASGIFATCQKCHHEARFAIDRFAPDVLIPDISLRMSCSRCGSKDVRTRPDWRGRQTGPRISRPTPDGFNPQTPDTTKRPEPEPGAPEQG